MKKNKQILEAKKILENIGKIKSSTASRRESKSLSEIPEIKNLTKACLRAALREPDAEVMQQLYLLHEAVKRSFLSIPEEGVTWLLGGSITTSRGGFQDSKNQKAAQAFKEFLLTDPKKIKIQILITKIETILSSMGYRSYYSPNSEKPHNPETEPQKLMDAAIQSLMKSKMVRAIGDVYTDKPNSFVDSKQYPLSDPSKLSLIEAEDVSTASEAEEQNGQPKAKMSSKVFKNLMEDEKVTWLKIAVDSGVPVRCHASGTAPLVLAAIAGLYDSVKGEGNWFDDDKNVKKLSSTLLIAPFERGDFHTIAETSAGINHFLHERATDKDNKPMLPIDAFKNGLNMLISGCSDTVREGESMSLQAAISIINKYLMELISISSKATEKEQLISSKIQTSDPKPKPLSSSIAFSLFNSHVSAGSRVMGTGSTPGSSY